jgi:Domain of unknown function (DUF4397)
MQRSIRGLVSLLASLALVAAFAAPAAAADSAYVRVVHASPDAPNVDVWVDGGKVLSDVAYTAVSDYLALAAGTYNVQVVETGTTSPAFIDANLTFEAGKGYTIAATGKVSDSTFGPVVLSNDDLTPVAGKAKLRVFHASTAAPASVDVALAPGGAVLVPGLAFNTATDYLELDPATYDLEIRAAGDSAAALTISPTVAAATNYTAIAMDGGDAGVQVIIAVDAAGIPDTALPQGGAPLGLIGAALLALAIAMVVIRGVRRQAVQTEA